RGKIFVDFLFHIMSLPVATVVSLVTATDMVGCLGVLYKSIESLNTNYFQPDSSKNSVLKSTPSVSVPLLSLTNAPTTGANDYYTCSSYCRAYISGSYQVYVTDDPSAVCPGCKNSMSTKVFYVAPKAPTDVATTSSQSKGFVKGVVTYMVMDNLEVKAMSTISGITLMNKFHVKDVSSLVEKEVQVTLNEALEILKASLETKSVLTTVILVR
ncbi:hypothetical protein RND81_08G213700, partial [Saponaria officinalis]